MKRMGKNDACQLARAVTRIRARCLKTDWPSRIVQIVPALEKQIQGRLRSGKGMLAIA